MIKDLKVVLKNTKPDILTFSGLGELPLAKNIDLAIEKIRNISNIPIAILTNSSIIDNKDVIKSLNKIDIVVAKLDATHEKLF